MMHPYIVPVSSTWRASPLCDTRMKPFRHPLTLVQIDHTRFCSSLYTRTAFHPWHTGCGRSTCYAVTMVTRNSICLFDGSYACTRHIVEFFLSRFFFSFFYLFILRACVYVFFFFFTHLIADVMVLLIFLTILRFLWDFTAGIDVIVLFPMNEGKVI